MVVTLSGIVTLVRLVQLANAACSDASDAVGNRDAGQAAAARNAPSPMLVTLLGMVRWSRWCSDGTPCPRCWRPAGH